MSRNRIHHTPHFQPHCCPHEGGKSAGTNTLTRRTFLKGVGATALGGMALSGLSWPLLSAEGTEEHILSRIPLKVKPILVYSTPERRHQRSWRAWGAIQTQMDADEEVVRIKDELKKIQKEADFPVDFLPVARVRGTKDLAAVKDLASSHVILIYAAGGWMDVFHELEKAGKDMIFFCRHKSGPVYLWYEIISPRYLRQHTDTLAVEGVDEDDVVIDSQEEILWRLRSLCGLNNMLGTKILAVGGPGAWSQPKGVVPRLVKDIWNWDIQTISYDELGKLIKEARSDGKAVTKAHLQASSYLGSLGTALETKPEFVENAFLLDHVFRALMKKADCSAITINGCMGTIMPYAETSACLTLSTLNDSGYLAFCESDFVVIPSGVLLGKISGRPVFLNDPTYPHEGIITLAHCTAPRKMDGQKREPARILTHFESDYGAAPKVEMSKGQVVTNIVPDFVSKRWVGLLGEIVDAPFMPICRSQIDIRFTCDDRTLAKRMPGFHWMTCYGDYMREVGYALKRVNIVWDCLS
jgi:hypothetical protein